MGTPVCRRFGFTPFSPRGGTPAEPAQEPPPRRRGRDAAARPAGRAPAPADRERPLPDTPCKTFGVSFRFGRIPSPAGRAGGGRLPRIAVGRGDPGERRQAAPPYSFRRTPCGKQETAGAMSNATAVFAAPRFPHGGSSLRLRLFLIRSFTV